MTRPAINILRTEIRSIRQNGQRSNQTVRVERSTKQASNVGLIGNTKLDTNYSWFFAKVTRDSVIEYSNPLYGGIDTYYLSIFYGENPGSPGECAPGSQSSLDAKNEAIVKVQNKVSQQRLELGTELAEARSTARHLADTASQIARALLAARRSQWKSVARILGLKPRDILYGRYPANKWLEYQYGWLPLFSLAFDLKTEFTRKVTNERMIQFAKSGARRSVQGPVSNAGITGGSGIVKCTHFASACVRFQIDTTTMASELNSIGLLNPLSVAWEVVPFSFVLDWFIPIGQSLSALSAYCGKTISGGYVTTGSRLVTDIVSNSGSQVRTRGRYRSETFRGIRSAGAPEIGFRTYFKEKPFSDTHVASAVALTRALM